MKEYARQLKFSLYNITCSKYQKEADGNSEITVIVFHCKDKEEQSQFIKSTQFCVVGNNVCYREKDSQKIQIMKLRNQQMSHIPDDRDDVSVDQLEEEGQIECTHMTNLVANFSIDAM